MPFAPSSFLFLVVRPGAPSSVLAPSGNMPSKLQHFIRYIGESKVGMETDAFAIADCMGSGA